MSDDALVVPEDELNEVREILRNIAKPKSVDLTKSRWISSCLVKQRLENNPELAPHAALREVFTEILDILRNESPSYAEILGLFWEGFTVSELARSAQERWHWSETTFYNNYRNACEQFTYLLLEKENACKETPHPITQYTHMAIAWADSHRHISFFIFALVAIGLIGTIITVRALSPPQTLTVCGETERIEALPGPQFIRNQGISAFTVENTSSAVLDSRVRAVAIDHRGLFIGYFAKDKSLSGSLGHYDKHTWAQCAPLKKPAGVNINDVAIDIEGHIWIATEQSGVHMLDGDTWNSYTIDNKLPSDATYGITLDTQGNVWIATWEGVAKFDGTSWSVPYSVNNDTLFNNRIHTIAFDGNSDIWVGHIDHGISHYHNADGTWTHHTTETSGLGGNKIRRILVHKSDENESESIWIATADGGVSVFSQDAWKAYNVEDGLPSNDVSDLATDKYNRIWAATLGGVAYFEDGYWIIYDTIPTHSIAFAPNCQECPFEDGDHVWTGTTESGLTHSRLPHLDNKNVVQVKEVCFVSVDERERICPDLVEMQHPHTITATYPRSLTPEEKLRFEIVVVPRASYELKEPADFLSNTDESDDNLFGAWPIIPVKGTINPGQPFTFTDPENPLVAPQLANGEQEHVFTSTWRVWMHTRYVGPSIRIDFTVQNP